MLVIVDSCRNCVQLSLPDGKPLLHNEPIDDFPASRCGKGSLVVIRCVGCDHRSEDCLEIDPLGCGKVDLVEQICRWVLVDVEHQAHHCVVIDILKQTIQLVDEV